MANPNGNPLIHTYTPEFYLHGYNVFNLRAALEKDRPKRSYELAARIGVHPRTVHRCVKALRRHGVRIKAFNGPGGGIFL